MGRSSGLERLGDVVDLVVMLEVLLGGLEDRESLARSVVPGVRHSLKHLRSMVCEASEQLAEELTKGPSCRESLVVAGRGDKGPSLAQRIQTLPADGFKSRELEPVSARSGGD